MSGIFWLASYPKSGNTWLRALLTNYRLDRDEPVSINDLEGDPTASVRETFDECAGIDSADLTPQQIEYYRPQVCEWLAAESVEPLFLKIHDAYTYNANGRPLFSERATSGAIYLIRNPLDVAVSYAHHRAEAVDDTIRAMSREDAMLAGSDKPGNLLPQKLLSWSAHVCSWLDQPTLKVHVVRYEDMVREPLTAFLAIVRFARLGVDPRRVRQAVEFSSFERLQSQEAAHGFCEKQPTALSFFREGRAGAWREHLTAPQVRQVVVDHREIMRRFGYLSGSDEILC